MIVKCPYCHRSFEYPPKNYKERAKEGSPAEERRESKAKERREDETPLHSRMRDSMHGVKMED